MSKTAYYMRTSHYLQNIDTQLDKVEEGWKVYKDEGISGRIYFADSTVNLPLTRGVNLSPTERGQFVRLFHNHNGTGLT